PSLRNATRHITVTVTGGTMKVSIEGTQVLSSAVTLSSSVLIGFTGATGGATDRHAVSNVVVTLGQVAPTLTINESTVANGTRATQGFSFSGTCPSTFTAGPLTSGQTASPALISPTTRATCHRRGA